MKLYEVGEKIKTLRKEKKITQQQLAQRCGISRVTIGKIENGDVHVTLKTLDLMLHTLGYEIEFKKVSGFGLPTLDEIES